MTFHCRPLCLYRVRLFACMQASIPPSGSKLPLLTSLLMIWILCLVLIYCGTLCSFASFTTQEFWCANDLHSTRIEQVTWSNACGLLTTGFAFAVHHGLRFFCQTWRLSWRRIGMERTQLGGQALAIIVPWMSADSSVSILCDKKKWFGNSPAVPTYCKLQNSLLVEIALVFCNLWPAVIYIANTACFQGIHIQTGCTGLIMPLVVQLGSTSIAKPSCLQTADGAGFSTYEYQHCQINWYANLDRSSNITLMFEILFHHESNFLPLMIIRHGQ